MELMVITVDYAARGINIQPGACAGWSPLGTLTTVSLDVVHQAREVLVTAEVWSRRADPVRLERATGGWADDECPCCGCPHAECWRAQLCIGGCGKLTTPHESAACGYCLFCTADPGWVSLTDVLPQEAAR